MQFKKILAYALTVCLLLSLTIPAYAVEEVYDIADDVVPASVIYYSEGYYPGLIAEMRSSMTFANNRIAYGSYASGNYTPTYFYRNGSSLLVGDLPLYYPDVIADQSDVSAVSIVPVTSLVSGSFLSVKLPASNDAYFDFQSSNFLFDQQSPDANTFYVNGDLTFNLRNLWSFSGSPSNDSFYLASDPLAVQLLIDGKPYGDILDVTGYISPFTSLYGGAIPVNATVHFDNMKVYYQGDTPDMIGFRVLTGSAFTDGRYNYNDGGEFTAVSITNTITFRCSELPDITFVQEGGDGYAGDLSGIQSVLSSILNGISGLSSLLNELFLTPPNSPFLSGDGNSVSVNDSVTLKYILRNGFLGLNSTLKELFLLSPNTAFLEGDGSINSVYDTVTLKYLLRSGFLGLRSLMVDSSGNSWLSSLYSSLNLGYISYLYERGWTMNGTISFGDLVRQGFLGLHAEVNNTFDRYLNQGGFALSGSVSLANGIIEGFLGLGSLSRNAQSYVADTVFPWQSYNMETHQLNTATSITGQNNLFFTAFQSIEDKLGRLAYVFGSDEDLALKDAADPGTDAFRENFGGGLSIGQIKDGADVVAGVNGLFDSGYSFGDAFTEIAGEAGFFAWFTPENAAALDSVGSVMALDDSDPYNMQIYYDHIQSVKEKREAGDD